MISEGLLNSDLIVICNQSQNQPRVAALGVGRAPHASLWCLLRHVHHSGRQGKMTEMELDRDSCSLGLCSLSASH